MVPVAVLTDAEEGGGTTTVPFFSSQEWASTIVDTAQKYIGRWGLTLHSFNAVTRKQVRIHCILLVLGVGAAF